MVPHPVTVSFFEERLQFYDYVKQAGLAWSSIRRERSVRGSASTHVFARWTMPNGTDCGAPTFWPLRHWLVRREDPRHGSCEGESAAESIYRGRKELRSGVPQRASFFSRRDTPSEARGTSFFRYPGVRSDSDMTCTCTRIEALLGARGLRWIQNNVNFWGVSELYPARSASCGWFQAGLGAEKN